LSLNRPGTKNAKARQGIDSKLGKLRMKSLGIALAFLVLSTVITS